MLTIIKYDTKSHDHIIHMISHITYIASTFRMIYIYNIICLIVILQSNDTGASLKNIIPS